MSDLQIEKYRIKAKLAKSESNLQQNWGKFKSSFTFSNITGLVGETLFPEFYSKSKSKIGMFSGFTEKIGNILINRLVDWFTKKKD